MAGKSVAKKKRVGRYLALPYHILNLTDIGLCQKVLLAHIYGFGARGCYQSNKTIADIFMVSPFTISRWITDIREHLLIKNSKGYHRNMWAKANPEVGAAVAAKKNAKHLGKSVEHVRRKCVGDLGKSAIGLTQKCQTINTKTNKEIKKEITPPPLPGRGQSAVMSERSEQGKTMAEQFKKSFGNGPIKKSEVKTRLTADEFEQRRQQQLRALTAI